MGQAKGNAQVYFEGNHVRYSYIRVWQSKGFVCTPYLKEWDVKLILI